MKEFKAFQDYVDLLYSVKNKDLLEDLLMGVTTPAERRELVRRLEIVRRLLLEQPHQAIAESLHVGIATVTRGSKELAQGRFKVLKK